MKSKLMLLTALCGLFISCSSDSNDSSDQPSNFSVPLTNNKFWTYDVTDGTTNTRDSLYISGDTLINTITYKKFKTKDNTATGFYSSSLRNNGVRELSGKLLMSGDMSLAGGQQLPINLDLTLSDFIIFKNNATLNELLSTKTGTIQQDFNGFPLTINYTLKSIGGENLTSFTSPDATHDVYNTVKTAKIVLTASVTTVVTVAGIPFTQTILAEQDVVTSTQYLADGIGVVYVNTVTSYNMNPTIASQLGIPANNTQTQEEFLDTHN